MTDSIGENTAIPEGFSGLLKLEGGEANQNQARAEHLGAVLQGMQKIAYLLSTVETGQEIGERLRPNRAMRESYAILCGTPQAGSYAVPLDVGTGNRDLDLTESMPLLDKIHAVLAAVASENETELRKLLPGALYRKALGEVQRLLPRDQDGVSVSLQTRASPRPASISQRAVRFIKQRLAPIVRDDTIMTVTGELQRIDFASRQVTIVYPPTRHEIICSYLPEIEDSIVESRKDPIQVTGKFVLDEDGSPKSLTNVTRIEPVDLTPIIVPGIEALGLELMEPLELQPSLDTESQQFLVVSHSDIGLDVFAQTRDLLIDEIQEQMAMLWLEYACADSETLDVTAQALKNNLRRLMKEAGDAKTQG